MHTDPDRTPRYFHLLSDAELADLRPLVAVASGHAATLVNRWWELYCEHFGDTRTLSEGTFSRLCHRDLDALARTIQVGDLEAFEVAMHALGGEYLALGIPFSEIVASLHLLEESANELFRFRGGESNSRRSPDLLFDRLSHVRMIIFANAYFAERGTSKVPIADAELSTSSHVTERRTPTHFHGLVGAAPSMRRLYEQIAAIGAGRGAVFIVGESGTGKELIARALHTCSGRSGPFVAVNCASLPRELVESELFGHRKGAYTGASSDYAGLVRSASGGTLFLDEVTEMAADTQAKLLRVLEDRTVRPVGADCEMKVDVRFVASTNRVPEAAVDAGFLRHDLFYRLNVHRIVVAALRDRMQDAPLLVEHFAKLFALEHGGLRAEMDAEALAAVGTYGWPGNVRELRNAVEHGLTVGDGRRILARDLPPHILDGTAAHPLATARRTEETLGALEDVERNLIRRAMETTGGNKVRAARLLRISRHRLYNKLDKHGLLPRPARATR